MGLLSTLSGEARRRNGLTEGLGRLGKQFPANLKATKRKILLL